MNGTLPTEWRPDLRIPWFPLLLVGLLALVPAGRCAVAQSNGLPPANLRHAFRIPEDQRAAEAHGRSPLGLADGTRVKTAAQWRAARETIREQWHAMMGPWPPLITEPRVTLGRVMRRDTITQQQVRLQIGLGSQWVDGFLLIPAGVGPFPAVLVLYYDAQTGVGLGTPLRDFGWQLARRGFVTLSIGKPNTGVNLEDPAKIPGKRAPYFGPPGEPVRVQPLSALAYAAANAHTVLAHRPDVDASRIGVIGHSFGGKWALFASCLYDRFACAVWSDPGIVFDERDRRKENPGGSVNYWDTWYLGFELGRKAEPATRYQFRKLPGEGEPRTGSYRQLVAGGHDLYELHALMAPRPFLVSGGTADRPERWQALNHSVAVNRLLGHSHRVALTSRPTHAPTAQSNGQIYDFFQWWLQNRTHHTPNAEETK